MYPNNTFALLNLKKNTSKWTLTLVLTTNKSFLKVLNLASPIFYFEVSNYYFENLESNRF